MEKVFGNQNHKIVANYLKMDFYIIW